MDFSKTGFTPTQYPNTKTVRRGEVYYIRQLNTNYTDNTNVQVRLRPMVIISNDTGNTHSPIFICTPMTSRPKKWLPTHVKVIMNGIENQILCEQIFTVDKELIMDKEPVDILSDEVMNEIDKALIISLGIRCNAKPNILMEKYYAELERRIKQDDFSYDREGYLVKTNIVRVPVIEKSSMQNTDETTRLKEELARERALKELYKEQHDKMFERLLQAIKTV